MKKIKESMPSIQLVIDLCCQGIVRDTNLSNRLEYANLIFQNLSNDYISLGFKEDLYSLEYYVKTDIDDPLVASNLLHSELTKIYSDFFSKKGKPARVIYDEIKANALDVCPYCSIGSPENLDHYLPKAFYPQFSITPFNLIPACLDCNMGSKGSAYANNKEDQILHPYLDPEFYFEQQWIEARINRNGVDSIVVEYSVSPPDDWDEYAVRRVEKHFNSFNLGKRYSVQANVEVGILQSQINLVESGIYTLDSILDVAIDPNINNYALPINHWKRVFYVSAKEYFERHKRVINCIRCNSKGILLGVDCDQCDGMGALSVYKFKGLGDMIYDPVTCPNCDPTFLYCQTCMGTHEISLEKAHSMGNI